MFDTPSHKRCVIRTLVIVFALLLANEYIFFATIHYRYPGLLDGLSRSGINKSLWIADVGTLFIGLIVFGSRDNLFHNASPGTLTDLPRDVVLGIRSIIPGELGVNAKYVLVGYPPDDESRKTDVFFVLWSAPFPPLTGYFVVVTCARDVPNDDGRVKIECPYLVLNYAHKGDILLLSPPDPVPQDPSISKAA